MRYRGRSAVTAVPLPGALRSEYVPPIASTRARRLPRPIPVSPGASKPDPIDLQDDPALVVRAKRHATGGSGRVLSHIGQCLTDDLDHVAGARGEFGCGLFIDVCHRHDARAFLESRAELADRLVELSIGQDARAQPKM